MFFFELVVFILGFFFIRFYFWLPFLEDFFATFFFKFFLDFVFDFFGISAVSYIINIYFSIFININEIIFFQNIY